MRAHPAGPLHGNLQQPTAAGAPPSDLGALDPHVWDAVRALPLAGRDDLRVALRATMIKREEHLAAYAPAVLVGDLLDPFVLGAAAEGGGEREDAEGPLHGSSW